MVKKSKSLFRKSNSSGLGEISKVNGLIKTHLVRPHMKRTKQGYTFVDSYARSKGIK